MNEEQAIRASMSLADEIRKLVEQSLFIEKKITPQTMQIATFALCRVLGTLVGSVAPDRHSAKRAIRSMEPSIIGFAADMQKGIRKARSEIR